MLIFAIDDEPHMLELLHKAIARAEPEAEITDFDAAEELLDAIRSQGRRPDVVFADIEMPDMDGLSLAVQIKNEVPDGKIVFVTGYSEYAMEAYRRHVNGYLLKPAQAEKIREELDNLGLSGTAPESLEKLRVQCFGNFEVFWHGEPLLFHRTQTRELLAYLVDRGGATCTSGEIIATLWEGSDTVKNQKHYLRVLLQDLRDTLASVGAENVLVRERRLLAVRREMVDCDYYRMLDGDPAAVNAYRGEYMRQYSWAELTTAKLHFSQK